MSTCQSRASHTSQPWLVRPFEVPPYSAYSEAATRRTLPEFAVDLAFICASARFLIQIGHIYFHSPFEGKTRAGLSEWAEKIGSMPSNEGSAELSSMVAFRQYC